MLLKLIAIGIPVCVVLTLSLIGFVRDRNLSSGVQLIGSTFLLVVVLAHVAETYHLLSRMGWGSRKAQATSSIYSARFLESLCLYWGASQDGISGVGNESPLIALTYMLSLEHNMKLPNRKMP